MADAQAGSSTIHASSDNKDQNASAHAASRLRHEFYQTDTNVVVSLFIKKVKQEDLKVDIQPRSLSVTIKLPTGAETVFDLDPLSREIDPAQSSAKPLSTKIEITLRKIAQGVKWNKLEGDEEGPASSMNSATTRSGPSYPSSARHKGNWDAILKDVMAEENKPADTSDPNAGGDKELNKLFQKLYAGATDEQRMAMMKSYSESNGTALSTDWADVKKGKVETKPPDGVVARDWSGKDAKYEARDDSFLNWAKSKK